MSELTEFSQASSAETGGRGFIDYRDWLANELKGYGKAKTFLEQKVAGLIESGEASDEKHALEILEATYEHMQRLLDQAREIARLLSTLPSKPEESTPETDVVAPEFKG